MNVTLFSSSGPNAKITVIWRELCPKELLLVCNVPEHATQHVSNCTRATLLNDNPIFVRGVNSCFYEVEIDEEKYFVHEQYVKKEK